jgi:mono/diheme cytochrome c family protein
MRSILTTVGILAVVGIGGFAFYAYHRSLPEMSATERPGFDPAQVEQGRVLAQAGYCATCHTASGGALYAGNYPVVTNFGTIYASNITPDPETGIGAWSPEAFRRAMHEGVDRAGRHLFPAFPYDHFTKLTDADVDALYAYFMTEVAPVKEETKAPTIAFPFNQRFLQAGWKLLFVDFGRFEPDAAQSAEWNRGAYLAEGIAHCGACHTPRNKLGAEIRSEQYAGAVIDGWTAPALTARNPSAVPWTGAEFAQYLGTGFDRFHGVAAGPMGPVALGVGALPEADTAAMGAYFGAIANAPAADPATNAVVAASIAAGLPNRADPEELGARLYASACAACHYNATAEGLNAEWPDLGINSATRLDDPANLIHLILDGVSSEDGIHGVVMPAYRAAFDDAQIAAIAAYLRARRADLPPWPDLEAEVGAVRARVGTH